ncbi:MAG: factor-independent urate hydroxylase [Actinomadura sp.]
MSQIVLGPNRYGKAETRVVRVTRADGRDEIKDLNVSVALSGDMTAVHLHGDNAAVLTTDTQKNTVYAFARKHGIATAETFALLLARHFAGSQPTVHRALVTVEEYAWDRVPVTGHSFVRRGQEVRTARVAVDGGGRAHVVSGLRDLTVLNSAGSEFWGYVKDEYTTLPETRDRILATCVNAEWRHAGDEDTGWDESHATVRGLLLDAFATTYSLSLQQTLYAMGRQVLEECPAICEVRLSMPNRHHFAVDLEPFGMDNPNEVFFAADRPYGLIEGAVLRDDAPPDGEVWS